MKSTSAEDFDPKDYRRTLGQFATGVTVVTTRGQDGRFIGLTVNSFTSVSLQPPLVLWCLVRQSPSLAAFQGASHFAINISGGRAARLVPAVCFAGSRPVCRG